MPYSKVPIQIIDQQDLPGKELIPNIYNYFTHVQREPKPYYNYRLNRDTFCFETIAEYLIKGTTQFPTIFLFRYVHTHKYRNQGDIIDATFSCRRFHDVRPEAPVTFDDFLFSHWNSSIFRSHQQLYKNSAYKEFCEIHGFVGRELIPFNVFNLLNSHADKSRKTCYTINIEDRTCLYKIK